MSKLPSFFRHERQKEHHELVWQAEKYEKKGLSELAVVTYKKALDVFTKIMADTLDESKLRTYRLACSHRDSLQSRINALEEDTENSP